MAAGRWAELYLSSTTHPTRLLTQAPGKHTLFHSRPLPSSRHRTPGLPTPTSFFACPSPYHVCPGACMYVLTRVPGPPTGVTRLGSPASPRIVPVEHPPRFRWHGAHLRVCRLCDTLDTWARPRGEQRQAKPAGFKHSSYSTNAHAATATCVCMSRHVHANTVRWLPGICILSAAHTQHSSIIV